MASAPPSATPSSKVYTYHCLCSTLLLATPYNFRSLPRRKSESSKGAYILPVPALAQFKTDRLEDANAPAPATEDADFKPSLFSPALRQARASTVVRLEDGFERRRPWKCQRCGLNVAYEIEGDAADQRKASFRGLQGGRVVCFLPGGLIETGDLRSEVGKKEAA